MRYTDLFLYDHKAPEKDHKRLTGVGCEVINEGLGLLLSAGKRVILRCPIVPGVNDDETALEEYISRYPGLSGVERLPYHDLGVCKGDALAPGRYRHFELKKQ